MIEKKLVRNQDGDIIQGQPSTEHFYSVRYGAKVKTFDDFRDEDDARRWVTVYFNNFESANNFALFIKSRFGHAWMKREDCVPEMFYESIEYLLLGMYWRWHRGFQKWRLYKNVHCCFEPLCIEDLQKDPS